MEAVYIIGAAVFNTIFNGVWATFFRQSWRRAWNVPAKKDIASGPAPYLISFIGSLWASYGLFLIIKHVHPKNMEELLTIAVGLWLLVLIAMSAKYYAFEGRSMMELVIDYTQDLVSFILISYILWGN